MTPRALAELHSACFPDDPMSENQANLWLKMTAARMYCVNDAFLLTTVVPPEAEIISIGVHPRARRTGQARRLIAQLQSELETIHLEVAESNSAAIALYLAAGFEITGRRSGYYDRPDGYEDAVLMLWTARPLP